MKKFPFLLLDAGPVIKLFELALWGKIIDLCDVNIARTVVEEVIYIGQCGSLNYINFPFEKAAQEGRIKIIDMAPPAIQSYLRDSAIGIKYIIDPGEAETLAFLANRSENFIFCSADGSVFRALGFLAKAETGRSLEEVLKQIGLQPGICWDKITPRDKDWWKYTKKFREHYTRKGQMDSIPG